MMSQRIVIDPNDPVTCPGCSHEFPLVQGISNHLIERYEDEYEAKLSSEREELEARAAKKAEKKLAAQFEDKLSEMNEELEESKAEREGARKKFEKVTEKAAAKAKEDALEEIEVLRQELGEKDGKLKTYRETELQLRKEKQAIEEQKKEIELTVQRRLEEQQSALRSEINHEFQLREAEF
jgi:DNA repair exonuclease SbcCD ATPase subunit